MSYLAACVGPMIIFSLSFRIFSLNTDSVAVRDLAHFDTLVLGLVGELIDGGASFTTPVGVVPPSYLTSDVTTSVK